MILILYKKIARVPIFFWKKSKRPIEPFKQYFFKQTGQNQFKVLSFNLISENAIQNFVGWLSWLFFQGNQDL